MAFVDFQEHLGLSIDVVSAAEAYLHFLSGGGAPLTTHIAAVSIPALPNHHPYIKALIAQVNGTSNKEIKTNIFGGTGIAGEGSFNDQFAHGNADIHFTRVEITGNPDGGAFVFATAKLPPDTYDGNLNDSQGNPVDRSLVAKLATAHLKWLENNDLATKYTMTFIGELTYDLKIGADNNPILTESFVSTTIGDRTITVRLDGKAEYESLLEAYFKQEDNELALAQFDSHQSLNIDEFVSFADNVAMQIAQDAAKKTADLNYQLDELTEQFYYEFFDAFTPASQQNLIKDIFGTGGGSPFQTGIAHGRLTTSSLNYEDTTDGSNVAIISFGVAASGASSGASVEVTFTIKNLGDERSARNTVDIVLANSSDLQSGRKIGDTFSVPALDPGEERTLARTADLPISTNGNFFLGAHVRSNSLGHNTNQYDDFQSVSFRVAPGLSGDPDLQANLASLSGGFIQPGVSETVTYSTQTNANGAPEYQHQIVLSKDEAPSSDDVILAQRTNDGLGSNGVEQHSVDVIIPAGTPDGIYYLITLADSDNRIRERREDNNFAVSEIIVTNRTSDANELTNIVGSHVSINADLLEVGSTYTFQPFFYTDSVDDPAPVDTNGNPIIFERTLYLSTDATPSPDDVPFYTSLARINDPFAYINDSSVSLTLPNWISYGEYYVYAVIDSGNVVVEDSETDNVTVATPVTILNTNTPQIFAVEDNITIEAGDSGGINLRANDIWPTGVFSNDPYVLRFEGTILPNNQNLFDTSDLGFSYTIDRDGMLTVDAITLAGTIEAGEEITALLHYELRAPDTRDSSLGEVWVTIKGPDDGSPPPTSPGNRPVFQFTDGVDYIDISSLDGDVIYDGLGGDDQAQFRGVLGSLSSIIAADPLANDALLLTFETGTIELRNIPRIWLDTDGLFVFTADLPNLIPSAPPSTPPDSRPITQFTDGVDYIDVSNLDGNVIYDGLAGEDQIQFRGVLGSLSALTGAETLPNGAVLLTFGAGSIELRNIPRVWWNEDSAFTFAADLPAMFSASASQAQSVASATYQFNISLNYPNTISGEDILFDNSLNSLGQLFMPNDDFWMF